MGAYKINKFDLINDLILMYFQKSGLEKSQYSLSEYKRIMYDYNYSIDTIMEYFEIKFPYDLSYNLNQDIVTYEIYKDLINKLHPIKVNKNFPVKEKELDLTNDEMFLLYGDFFKSYSKDLYEYYKKFYRVRKKSVDINNSHDFFCFSNSVFKKSYIQIGPGKTSYDLVAGVHELTHLLFTDMSDYKPFDSRHLFEIESTFMELVFYDYLNNLFQIRHESNNNKIQYLKLINFFINEVHLKTTLINNDAKIKNIVQFIKESKKINNLNFKESLYSTKNSLSDDITYTIPYIIAIELYSQHQKDKDKAFNSLTDIALNKHGKNLIHLLERNNIYPYEHMQEYVLSLKN